MEIVKNINKVMQINVKNTDFQLKESLKIQSIFKLILKNQCSGNQLYILFFFCRKKRLLTS